MTTKKLQLILNIIYLRQRKRIMSSIQKAYHTAENRKNEVLSKAVNATDEILSWFGLVEYFWRDYNDAKFWGSYSKKKEYLKYDIYSANIDTDNFLNTVFDEEHYDLWIGSITKILTRGDVKPGKTALKRLHIFLDKELYKMSKIDGIIFQDLADVNNKDYRINKFKYRKRIQFAIFNYDNVISDFKIEERLKNS